MSNSALLGQPPNTEDDYYVVKAIMASFHLPGGDPTKGISLGPRPLIVQNNSRGPQIITASIFLIVLVVLITGSRLSIRAFHPKVKWGWDDWLIIPATGFTIVWLAMYILYAEYAGVGKHIYNLTYHEYYVFDKISKIQMLIFLFASTFTKLSLTLFLRRLIGLYSRFWIWVNNAFLALLCLYLVAFLFFDSFRCAPVTANFDLIASGKLGRPLDCLPINPGGAIRIYSHVAFDFCLLCTPGVILWRVQMPLAKKIGVFAMFSIGSVSCVGSVMTLVSEDHLDMKDLTYNFTHMMNWIIVDLFFGILVASAPILHTQLFKAWSAWSSIFKSRFSSRTNKDGSLRDSSTNDSSITESKPIHRHDDIERKFAAFPKLEYDLESGDNRSLDDQHSLGNHSNQVPDRLYHLGNNSAH